MIFLKQPGRQRVRLAFGASPDRIEGADGVSGVSGVREVRGVSGVSVLLVPLLTLTRINRATGDATVESHQHFGYF